MAGTNLHDDQGNILEEDMHANNITRTMAVVGTTVPSDQTVGYSTGCFFVHMDGGSATAFYVNEGSSISCQFRSVWSGAITSAKTISGIFTLAHGTDATVFLVPADRNNPVTSKNVAGRLAVQFVGESNTGFLYIPLYYA